RHRGRELHPAGGLRGIGAGAGHVAPRGPDRRLPQARPPRNHDHMAMGAGMMAFAVGLTADASFRMPMAVAVIGGGLINSNVLSLVVPAAITLVDDVEESVVGKLTLRKGVAATN